VRKWVRTLTDHEGGLCEVPALQRMNPSTVPAEVLCRPAEEPHIDLKHPTAQAFRANTVAEPNP
jgi:hypothetical protein